MFKFLCVFFILCGFLQAEQQKPNIVIIMVDDVGYSDFGCYGSEIKTPHIDSLAEGGLRFTNFYSENMCWVSRAAMLTGSYHKASLLDKGLHPAAVTLPEALKELDYKTYITGKWHLGNEQFPSPLDRGFDHFYGIPGGASSFFAPAGLTRDRTNVESEYLRKDYYFTNAISDEAESWIRKTDKSQPLFMYVAYTAAHWPLHAFEEDIEPYKGQYAMGWDELRKSRFKKQLQLGVIQPNAKLSPRHEDVPAWNDAPNKAWEQRRMEVYAAQMTVMDRGVGQIVKSLKDTDRFENTLILFTVDNGGCGVEYDKNRKGEFLPQKTRTGGKMIPGNLPNIMPGPENTYQSYGMNWANASNTPYRQFKKYDHEGGIKTPMIAHWPASIKKKGSIIQTPTHLVDIMPTIMDITSSPKPISKHNTKTMPLDGVSLKNIFETGDDHELHDRPLFFDHAGGKALRRANWKLVRKSKKKWELYNLKADPVELNNLAKKNPEKLQEMIQDWESLSRLMQKKNSL